MNFKHSLLTSQQIPLHKLRVLLGVRQESIVWFVFVDEVLTEESSAPGLTVEPYVDGVFVVKIEERKQCDDQTNKEESSHTDTD